ncbi:protein disulfide oxidoreductase [Halorhabdus amylolytica]|uniref:protein disulfide oxidoreductase n=1 Tax=Halorhabdus amylolytica TaxID=2559573 RepID=UPI0010AAE609|nr:thioredoxin family protein [Halorhabdus amylolytica]
MSILDEDDRAEVSEMLSDMNEPIDVHVFTEEDCQYCEETVELLADVNSLTDRSDLHVHDMDESVAAEMGADRYDGGPVTVITREDVSGVRYFGIPSGQEFSSFLGDMLAVSTGETQLDESVRTELEEIDDPVEITVFVTPTCPHCPRAVQTAHSLAIENEHVEANSVESQEFMELSEEFGVRGVPQINVNGTDGEFTGALPPAQFVQQIKQAL